MMVRLLAFALHVDEAQVFADSIGNDNEPSLRQKDLTGAIQIWIEGQPDEKRMRRPVDVWLNRIKSSLERSRNLSVVNLSPFSYYRLHHSRALVYNKTNRPGGY